MFESIADLFQALSILPVAMVVGMAAYRPVGKAKKRRAAENGKLQRRYHLQTAGT